MVVNLYSYIQPLHTRQTRTANIFACSISPLLMSSTIFQIIYILTNLSFILSTTSELISVILPLNHTISYLWGYPQSHLATPLLTSTPSSYSRCYQCMSPLLLLLTLLVLRPVILLLSTSVSRAALLPSLYSMPWRDLSAMSGAGLGSESAQQLSHIYLLSREAKSPLN